MVWLIAAVVAVFGLFFVGYRKVAFALTVLAMVVGVSLYYYYERQQEKATTRVAASEVVLENIILRHTFRNSYELAGLARNNSEVHGIDRIAFEITLRDCPVAGKASCAILGKTTASATVTIPPQEARQFIASMYFPGPDFKIKGRVVWDYEMTAIVSRGR